MYYNLTFLLLTYFNAYYTSIIRIIFVLKPVHIDGLNGLLVCNIELRVRLDTAENWKLKLKIEKYCSKIIFKCVNSTMGPIFNEKVVKKWNLSVHEQYMMHCLLQKSQHFAVTVHWTVHEQ